MHTSKRKLFAGFKHCGSQKVYMIADQGFDLGLPTFTTYKSAVNYRNTHNLQNHRVFWLRYTIALDIRNEYNNHE